MEGDERREAQPPLADVRVVSVEQYGAGPFATLQLAELGAEVIKIEDPASGGDVGRYVPPDADAGDSLFFQTFNHGKKSVALDLRNEAGRAAFEALVAESDVVFSNLRGDVPEKLRLRYGDLKHLNPALVCCSLSAFGTTGPRAAEPGYDYLVQGLAGWMSLTGPPGAPPTKTGLSLVDFASGYAAAAAILAAIHDARRTGRGRDADLSLYDVGLNLLTYVATWYATAGIVAERTSASAHPTLVPFQNFETADGWIVVACAKEVFWQRLVDVLSDGLLRENRFATFTDRAEHRDELLSHLESRFRRRNTDRWVQDLTAAGVPCAPVNDLPAALQEEQATARGLLRSFPHPKHGEVTVVRTPLRLSDDAPPTTAAPPLGEDTDPVLSDIAGVEYEQIRRWRRAGAFGQREVTQREVTQREVTR